LRRFSFLLALAVLQTTSYMAPDNAPGGTAPMEHSYKSHTILIFCWPVIEPFGFVPEIRINNKHQFVVKTFKFIQKFKTKAEAETYALQAAKEWIDEGNPELLQKAK
jgi:hypothetical protein